VPFVDFHDGGRPGRPGVLTASAQPLSAGFTGTWRRYQRVVLDAFERDRADGDSRFYAVLPPGAGKTLVGWEIARRLGNRTLVLAPNTAVQGQWAATWDRFFAPVQPCGTDRSLDAAVTALTYQSIAVIDRATSASQRRGVLRDGDRDALLKLLHPNGRAVIDRARASGPWTLVLDECHHLLDTWGALIRAVLDALGPGTALVGLTATPPRTLTGWRRELHDDLFGRTDIEIPTPALVKEGELAPYQELVYLTGPTAEEDTWLVAQHARFADLQVQLVDERLGTVPLTEWLERRVVRRGGADGPAVSWTAFETAEPALARAALRFAHAGIIPVPPGALLREQHRTHPDADDWVAVLADFCDGHLARSDAPADTAALAAIKRVMPGLGYRLTTQGVRAGTSPVDRLCGLSEAKIAATTHILDAEHTALGADLRALVLCDFELAPARAPAGLGQAPTTAGSGSARGVFAALAAADVGGPGGLTPLLVTGQTFACPRAEAGRLTAFCRAAGRPVEIEPLADAPALVRLRSPVSVPAWVWVRLATEYFTAGHARVLIGTRALLGEGWDCPVVNVTVDLTTAATPTSVTQMRGRALRLPPEQPEKVADNWTVCCLTDEHPRGDADYLRLVRKHDAHHALTAYGEIESGVSHCDPALSPYMAPAPGELSAITARALDRVNGRAAARVAWRIGEPYAGIEVATVRVHTGRPLGHSARVLPVAVLRPAPPGVKPRRGARPWLIASATGGGLGTGALTALAAGPPTGIATGVGLALLGAGALTGAAVRDSRALAHAPTALDQLAATVADALHEAGGADRGADAVRISPTPDGWLRCALTGVPEEQSRLFAAALDDVLAPLAEPRHLVGRRVLTRPPTRVGRTAMAVRAVLGLPIEGAVSWHAVPRWCAANPRRLRLFLAAWECWIGPAGHLTADSPEGAAVLQLFRGQDPFSITTQLRTVWT
jgi:superfamily II DNA or RNA helicase